jgi:ATP-binding cassette subfamily F protein uup
VLLLDEPTNDLDIDTLTELEDLLDGFGGSIVVVSHDRYFLERVTDHVLALVGARLIFLAGGVDEYLERLDAGTAGKPGAPPAPVPARPDVAAGGQSAGGQSAGSLSAGDLREARKELARLDRQLERLTGRESELHEALAEAAADYARLLELGEELRGLQAERAALEDRWLLLAEVTSR